MGKRISIHIDVRDDADPQTFRDMLAFAGGVRDGVISRYLPQGVTSIMVNDQVRRDEICFELKEGEQATDLNAMAISAARLVAPYRDFTITVNGDTALLLRKVQTFDVRPDLLELVEERLR